MQITAAFAALLCLAAAAPGEKSYRKDSYPKDSYPKDSYPKDSYPKAECYTTQTCKAVYTSYYKDVPTYYQQTQTSTAYKPYTTTIVVDETITKTRTVPSTYVDKTKTTYQTDVRTKTKTVETVTTTYVTTYLKDAIVKSDVTKEQPCTYTTQVEKPYTEVVQKPSTVVSQKPETYLTTATIATTTKSLCTDTTTSCSNKEICTTQKTSGYGY